MTATTFKVSYASNGVIVEVDSQDGEKPEVLVYQENGDNEKTGWAGFLRTLTEMYGPGYNKYGKEEVTIDIRPGRKCETADEVEWFLKDLLYREPTKEQIEKVITCINEVFKETDNE
jgi:hypothetical protein